MASWFRWPMLSPEFSAAPDRPGTCWPRPRAWRSSAAGPFLPAAGRNRRSWRGSRCRRTCRGGRPPRAPWAARCGPGPPAWPPDRRARPPRTSPGACGSGPARRRRPIARSPPRRSPGNRVNRSGAGVGTVDTSLQFGPRDSSSSQRRGQRMQRLAAGNKKQRPVEVQSRAGLPANSLWIKSTWSSSRACSMRANSSRLPANSCTNVGGVGTSSSPPDWLQLGRPRRWLPGPGGARPGR